MLVELNDSKFKEAKNGDLFAIEVKDGKKYATPISKDELLNTVTNTLNSLQAQINELKKEMLKEHQKTNSLITMQNITIKNHMGNQNKVLEAQNKKIDKYSKSIYEFIDIMKGETTNE